MPWFEQQGALVQELVPPQGYDLRILVAGRRVAGAIFRIAAEGEWRTNISLGGTRVPVGDPPQRACEIALAAARAAGTALVGVDLVQDGLGNWVVIELNGAVEFTARVRAGRRRLHRRRLRARSSGRREPRRSSSRVGVTSRPEERRRPRRRGRAACPTRGRRTASRSGRRETRGANDRRGREP